MARKVFETDILASSHLLMKTLSLLTYKLLFRKALLHGKHVLVEFPVATSAAATKELFSLAKEKGKNEFGCHSILSPITVTFCMHRHSPHYAHHACV